MKNRTIATFATWVTVLILGTSSLNAQFLYPQSVSNWNDFLKKFKIEKNAHIMSSAEVMKEGVGKYSLKTSEAIPLDQFKPSPTTEPFRLASGAWTYSLLIHKDGVVVIDDVWKKGDYKVEKIKKQIFVEARVDVSGKDIPAHYDNVEVNNVTRVKWSDPLRSK